MARSLRSSNRALTKSSCKLSVPCQSGVSKWWAHQDSNLERAGYEPAALTVELWARPEFYDVLPSRNARSFRDRDGWRNLRSALASI